MGAPCEDEGEELGLHGRASNLRAYGVYADGEWEGDDYIMWAQGKIRETRVFGENVVLERKISARIGENKLWLRDCVRNEGAEPTPHMILYHINGGFPAVDAGTELLSPTKEAIPRDADAEVEKEKFAQFLPPTRGFRERCYYHEMVEGSDGFVYAALVNKKLGFGFYVKYKKGQLPKFTEWKMNGWGTYVVGIEPGNAWVEGRAAERKRGTLQVLQPGEERVYELEIGVLASQEEIKIIEDKVKKSLKEG